MTRLRRVARNVANLAAMSGFYEVLGFQPVTEAADDPKLAALLEVERVVSLRLVLGAQELELTQLIPAGAPYPACAKSDDIFFQHIAIRTRDIAVMQERALRAGAVPITHNGPQRLPKASGGVIAWKFRDPEGHPIEFLELPSERQTHDEALTSGYDHSALCVSDVERSIGFYEALGLRLQHQHLNQGAAQARLDGLERGLVEVVAMTPRHATPHVELLGYPGVVKSGQVTRLNDIAADRLVFASTGNRMMLSDPDGHVLIMDGDEAKPMAR